MIKVVGKNVIDLLAYQSGILFVMKEPSTNGQIKISYYSFDVSTKSIATVTKNAYLMTKFGPGYAAITERLDDYISCNAVRLSDGRVFIGYPGGEIGVFSDNGELLHSQRLSYNSKAVSSIASDGKHLWFAVPESNLVVRYNTSKLKIDLRLGSTDTDTFDFPVSVSADKDRLFVCCKNSYSVKQICFEDLTVSEYDSFIEPVLQFLKIANGEFIVLPSGIYLM